MSSKRKDDKSVESEEDDQGAEISLPKGPVSNAWAIKIPEFKKGDMKSHLLEESSFSVLFPKYREKYIRECWPIVQKLMDEHSIKTDLDSLEGKMTVFTTRKTWDPYVILKARDVIKLLGRSVPVEQAIKVMRDDTIHEIIKIKNMVSSKERFVKRRQRLVGGSGTTLKALELLTDCYVLVQGATVATIGPHMGVQEVVRVVHDTMNNIHPVYLLKALMIKRELSKDENLKNEDWSRFIPKFTSKNVQRKKPKKITIKKDYTPFPPNQTERKVDQQMQEGKFYVDQDEEKRKKRKRAERDREANKDESDKIRASKKMKDYIPPVEEPSNSNISQTNKDVDIEMLKRKVKKLKKK